MPTCCRTSSLQTTRIAQRKNSKNGFLSVTILCSGMEYRLVKLWRAALRSHNKTIGRDCQKLRTFINDFLTSGLEYTSAAVLSETSVTSANNVPGEQETKEAPRLEPKVFERSSEVTEHRAEFGDMSVPTQKHVNDLSRVPAVCSIFCRCVDMGRYLDNGSSILDFECNPGFPPRGNVLNQPLGMRSAWVLWT